MTEVTNQPTLPPLTLVIEVPTREQLCENDTDKFAVKFGQLAQGALFAALKAHGSSVADIEALVTTSKSTIMGNQKMLKLRDGTDAVWGEVKGRQLHALMGGEIAAEGLSPQTQATVAAVEQRATEIGENAVQILDGPMGAGAAQPPASNVVPLGGQTLDPNQPANQPANPAPEGFEALPHDEAMAMVQAHVDQQTPSVQSQQPQQPQQQVYQQPQQPQQPAPQSMAPPAMSPPTFDVRQVDPALAQYLQPNHIAPHPTGDPASGVQQGEMMYWSGQQWLNRVATYSAMGQQPPETVGMLPPGGAPGQPAVGTVVQAQGPAVQRVQPAQGSWPHQ